jgi:Rrf2 family protein
MRLSKKSEYALRALVAVARKPPGQVHQIGGISRSENIPVKVLEQTMLALRHAGILASKRGAGGGYTLRRRPDSITVGEVLRLMEGPLAPVPCASPQPAEKCTCPEERTCPLRLLMIEVRDRVAALLDQRSIEDLVRMSPAEGALAFEI